MKNWQKEDLWKLNIAFPKTWLLFYESSFSFRVLSWLSQHFWILSSINGCLAQKLAPLPSISLSIYWQHIKGFTSMSSRQKLGSVAASSLIRDSRHFIGHFTCTISISLGRICCLDIWLVKINLWQVQIQYQLLHRVWTGRDKRISKPQQGKCLQPPHQVCRPSSLKIPNKPSALPCIYEYAWCIF